jgi:hypothetical protein
VHGVQAHDQGLTTFARVPSPQPGLGCRVYGAGCEVVVSLLRAPSVPVQAYDLLKRWLAYAGYDVDHVSPQPLHPAPCTLKQGLRVAGFGFSVWGWGLGGWGLCIRLWGFERRG